MGRGCGCSSLENKRWQTLQSSELGHRTSRGAKPGGRGAANQGVRAHCRLQHTVLWGETLFRAVSTRQDGLQEGPAERKLF